MNIINHLTKKLNYKDIIIISELIRKIYSKNFYIIYYILSVKQNFIVKIRKFVLFVLFIKF
jgi:hypothetical protein